LAKQPNADVAQSGTAVALRAISERYPGSNPGVGVELFAALSSLFFPRLFLKKAQEYPGVGVDSFVALATFVF
jgi:hypothetical protein